jgi:PAS domain S-box-containing protein
VWSFRDIPIKQKLVRAIMLTSTVVLLLTAIVLIIFEFISYRLDLQRSTLIRAQVIGNSSTAALRFDDEEGAREILSALRADRSITAAALYKNGRLFSFHPATLNPSRDLPTFVPERDVRFAKGELVLIEPVLLDNREIGTIYLQASLNPLYSRFKLHGAIVAAVLGVSVLAAYLLSSFLQKIISHPILELAQTARTVSERKDYSVRARKSGADELGALTDAFNDMLTQIHERDLALLESRQRLHLALKGSQTGTWDWDTLSGRLIWDEFMHELFGTKPGQFAGTYDAYLDRVHPEDRDRVHKAAENAMADKREYECEFRIIHPDESAHVMVARGRAFYDEGGSPVRMTGICMDISERKRAEEARRESEERMRSVVDHVVDGIITIDEAGKVESFNPAAEKIFGRTAAETIGQNVKILMPEPYHTEHDGYLQNYMRTGHRKIIGIGREVSGKRKDGTVFPLELAVSEFKLGPRRLFTGIVRDITERKRSEEEIRRLNAELEQRVLVRTAELAAINRELEAFTYSVSHDLRAPLRHIDGFAQILQEELGAQVDPMALHYLRRIRKGTQNMGQLVDDLLNFARIGRQELQRQHIDLNSIVEEVIFDLKPELQKRNLDWRVGRLPWAQCDPGLIKQVFTNLLSNAIKYTSPRETAVIEVQQVDKEGERAIMVRDNGVGFDMRYIDKLFGVFQRLHRPEEFEGTGVGLATVQRIVHRHGGRIWAEAEIDRGAAFYFTLEGIMTGRS